MDLKNLLSHPKASGNYFVDKFYEAYLITDEIWRYNIERKNHDYQSFSVDFEMDIGHKLRTEHAPDTELNGKLCFKVFMDSGNSLKLDPILDRKWYRNWECTILENIFHRGGIPIMCADFEIDTYEWDEVKSIKEMQYKIAESINMNYLFNEYHRSIRDCCQESIDRCSNMIDHMMRIRDEKDKIIG